MDIYSQIFTSREAHPLYTVTPVDAEGEKRLNDRCLTGEILIWQVDVN